MVEPTTRNIAIRTQPLSNETDLLVRMSEGDEKAFGVLFHHYRQRIYSYAYHLFGSKGLADELVQDVFLKVWLSRDKVRHILRFDSWLFIIARNQVFDTLKLLAKEDSVRKQMANLLDADTDTVEDQLLTKENELMLQEALSHLSPQQKLIFNMSRHQGMKHAEIASRLNISRNTVKTHLVHALKTLKDTLHFHSDGMLVFCLLLRLFFSY